MPKKTLPRKSAWRKKLATRLDRLLRMLAVVLCGVTVLGYFGPFWWVLDLFSHFRPILALLLVPVVLLLLICQHRVLSVVALGAAVLNFSALAPYLYRTAPREPPATAQRLKLFHANVLAPNNNYEELMTQIIEENPDVVTLTELTPGWINGLAALKSQYPYVVHNETQDRFGLAIWSRFPILRTEAQYLGAQERCAILAQLQLSRRCLTIVATHPWSPRDSELAERRDTQLRLLGEQVGRESGPRMLLGDLNITPWSYGFPLLLERSGLHDSQLDQGLAPTWPARSLIRIPIDHCLISEQVFVLSRRVGEDFGSDHLPLIVTVAVE